MMNSVANDILESSVGDFFGRRLAGLCMTTSTGFKASAVSSALCLTHAS